MTISRNMPSRIAGSNDLSGTVRVTGAATGARRMHFAPPVYRLSTLNRFTVYNLNIENTYGEPVEQSQAIALSAYGNRLSVYGSVISGWQDTLLANQVLLDSCATGVEAILTSRSRGLNSTLTHISKVALTLSLVRKPRYGSRKVYSRQWGASINCDI